MGFLFIVVTFVSPLLRLPLGLHLPALFWPSEVLGSGVEFGRLEGDHEASQYSAVGHREAKYIDDGNANGKPVPLLQRTRPDRRRCWDLFAIVETPCIRNYSPNTALFYTVYFYFAGFYAR